MPKRGKPKVQERTISTRATAGQAGKSKTTVKAAKTPSKVSRRGRAADDKKKGTFETGKWLFYPFLRP